MSSKKVPFFNYSWVYTQYQDEVLAKMKDVMKKGAFILQSELKQFEKNLAEFLNVKYAYGVADGTNALIIALQAAGIGKGDEVIVPSHTYIASAASIHLVGAKVVPVECGADHMLDLASAAKAVTKNTKAIMPVQLNGRTCDMNKVKQLADMHNLMIIEDAAQALGSRFEGQHAGTFGKAGTYSFYPAKVLGCFGDGGGVVTNDDEMGEKLAILRDHGRNGNGEVISWGTNSRLDNLQAAVLDIKLKYFKQDISRRRELAAIYNKELTVVSEVALPPAPDTNPVHFDIYQNYEIVADRRDDLKKMLADNGIGSLVQFGGKAVHQHKELGFDSVSLPYTEELYRKFLMLPMNTSLSDDDVQYVCSKVKEFYGAL